MKALLRLALVFGFLTFSALSMSCARRYDTETEIGMWVNQSSSASPDVVNNDQSAPPPTALQPTVTTPTSTEVGCLTSNSGWFDQRGNTGPCLGPTAAQTQAQQTEAYMLRAGVELFQTMQMCDQIARSRRPVAGSPQDQIDLAYALAARALARCYQDLTVRQMQLLQWNPPQTQALQNAEARFYNFFQGVTR